MPAAHSFYSAIATTQAMTERLLADDAGARSCVDYSDTIGLQNAIRLLSLRPLLDVRQCQSVMNAAKNRKRRVFGNKVFAIVPLYVSSICEEGCSYCNYRIGNAIGVDRRRLSDEELAAEAAFLVEEKGFGVIELVYSSDPEIGADTMRRHASVVRAVLDKAGGGMVGINARAMDADEYGALASAVDFVVLWQETYDDTVYRQVHHGPKADVEFRVTAYERMLDAGIRNIGMGVLSGLADYRRDWAMLLAHEDFLRNNYGIDNIILGMPRLKPAVGAVMQSSERTPSDDDLLLCLSIQSLYLPKSLPFVNTRESWEFCMKASKGGGVLMTFNCSTTPGGYTHESKGQQFPSANYDVESFGPQAIKQGFTPVMNWRFGDIGTRCVRT